MLDDRKEFIVGKGRTGGGRGKCPPCHLPFFLRGNCQFMLTHILLVLRDAAGGLKVTCVLGQRTYPLPRFVVIMPWNHGDNRACPQTTVTTQVPAVDIFVSPVTKTLPKIPWGGHNRSCGREGEGGGGRSGGGGDGATPFLYPQISMGVFSVLCSRPCHAKKYEQMTTKKNGKWITHVPGSLARAIVSMGGVVYICRSVPVKPVSSTSSDVRGQRVHRYFRNQKVSFIHRFSSHTSSVIRFRQHSVSPIEHFVFPFRQPVACAFSYLSWSNVHHRAL